MLKIINLPTDTVVAEYALMADAETALKVIETTPPTHEIIGTEEVAE